MMRRDSARGVSAEAPNLKRPSSRENPNIKLQFTGGPFWRLEFGASLVLGRLVVGAFPTAFSFRSISNPCSICAFNYALATERGSVSRSNVMAPGD